ncbi:hypothetical protein [Haloferula sargassicola]|uniref:hypothetical protein n=1 Tax=Haloferula sargassicola TaxID=490096 RepID=UPI00336574AC
MSDFQSPYAPEGNSPEHPRGEHPSISSISSSEQSRLKRAAECANHRLHKLTWPEIAVAALAGFAVGWLVASPRRHPSLHDILDDSLRPWASRGLSHASDSIRHSRPLNLVQEGISKLRAS